jgi:uncharacterized membrane protein YtjA (UPF0391 family)
MENTGLAGTSPTKPNLLKENLTMLRLAIVFLVIALIAAFFGFAGVADYSWAGAKILFFIFLVLAVLTFLGGTFRGRSFGR